MKFAIYDCYDLLLFNDFLKTSYLRLHWTDFHPVFIKWKFRVMTCVLRGRAGVYFEVTTVVSFSIR